MIIQCEGCAAKYFLPEANVPRKPTKVRCPQCTAVFTLVPQTQNVVAGAEQSVVTSPPKSTKTGPHGLPDGVAVSQPTQRPQRNAPRTPAQGVAEEEAVQKLPAENTEKPKPAGKRRARDGKDSGRARRLARVLVSDILCYNQEKRDQALIDGNLMAVLGDEIQKSWELYKEKVGAEAAKSTNYFKEALNEILADGQKVF